MKQCFKAWRGLLASALTAAGALAAAPAAALDAPAGKVVLTITGNASIRNAPEGASFDVAMLEKLPQWTFQTRTPWYAQPRKFTGVRLRDLLAAAGAQGAASVNATALNDYRVDIPASDYTRYDVMVAYLLDDKPMAVRDKGPLVVIYPFDAVDELRTAVHYSRAIWQLRSLDAR